MNSKEFIAYVRDCKRQGLDNGQIARKLGMDVGIFKDAVNHAYNATKEEPVFETVKPAAVAFEEVEEKPKTPRKPRKKVEGITYVPQNEDKSMN